MSPLATIAQNVKMMPVRVAFFFSALLLPIFRVRADVNVAPPESVVATEGISGLVDLIITGGGVLFWVLMSLATALFIIAGYMFVVSGGDETKVKKAKSVLLYGIIGVVVAMLSAAIPLVIGDIFDTAETK